MNASGREHAMDASGREHAMGASSREHAMGASSREHAMGASSREHAMDASSREHAMGASSREHAMGASSREHAMDASGREHAMGASGREHAMGASSREHAMGASGREHANGREHLFQRLPFAFPRTFYGSLGQCQGFAAPRKNRAPLTPPQPSTKSYREESEGKEQRTGAPGLRTTGCGFTPRPILETLTPAGISLLRAKNGLDKGVHLKMPSERLEGTEIRGAN